MVDMVLLGAGASVEAGVPMAHEMTKRVLEYCDGKSQQDIMYGHCAQLLRNVIGMLLHEKGTRGQNPLTVDLDIEELVSTLEILRDRRYSRLRPFAEWKRLIDLDDLARFLGPATTYPQQHPTRELLHHLRDSFESDERGPGNDDFSLVREFSDQVRTLADPRMWEHSLLAWALFFIQEYLDTVLWVNETRLAYLEPLVHLAKRQGALVIASLNYDNAVETVFRSAHTLCQTHESTWRKTSEFPTKKQGATLLKLHGSVAWQYHNGSWAESQVPREAVRCRPQPTTPLESWGNPPILIFGADNKLRATGPFLDLLFAYKQALKQADRLIAIGYSFRDDHVNVPIAAWFNSDANHNIVIVDPAFVSASDDSPRDGFSASLAQHEAQKHGRVRVIRKKASDAWQDFAGSYSQVK